MEAKLKAKGAEFKKAAKLPAGSPDSKGNGISVVSFTTENQEKAEILVDKLFKSHLIAEAQIVAASYEKIYMDGKKQI